MLTDNDWFNTNLPGRLKGEDLSFKILINPYNFQPMDFISAADYTAKLIYSRHKNLYCSLSGGMDSEYILRCFHRNNIPIIPIIIKCSNPSEFNQAIKICNELSIDPVVLEINDLDVYKFYHKEIFKKFIGIGINSTPNLIAALYVSKIKDAFIISGNHLMRDEELIEEKNFIVAPEWDFYVDYFLPNCININFFCYTLELVFASLPSEKDYGTSWIDHKSKLFQIDIRPKYRHIFADNLINFLNKTDFGIHFQKINRIDIWDREKFCNSLIPNKI